MSHQAPYICLLRDYAKFEKESRMGVSIFIKSPSVMEDIRGKGRPLLLFFMFTG